MILRDYIEATVIFQIARKDYDSYLKHRSLPLS